MYAINFSASKFYYDFLLLHHFIVSVPCVGFTGPAVIGLYPASTS